MGAPSESYVARSLRDSLESWELFTRKEEYLSDAIDEYGRFPRSASRSLALSRPIVSEWLVRKTGGVEYPDGHDFCLFLSHDVDIVNPQPVVRILRAMRARRGASSALSSMARRLNPAWNLRQIAEIERELDARSTFFLLAAEASDIEFNYTVSQLQEDVGYLLDVGAEVALHGGLRTSEDESALATERTRMDAALGIRVSGYRSHFLRFRTPKTWEILEKTRWVYDSTLGYPETIGFRNGMCHPFKPFDLNLNRELDVWEIPLAIMDKTMFVHMSMDVTSAWEEARRLLDVTRSCQGVLTILWHNNTFLRPEKARLYRKILAYGKAGNAWMTNGREIIEWWRRRDFFRGLL